MMQEETQLPVFFTPQTDDLMLIYDDVKTSVNSDQAASAAEGICPPHGVLLTADCQLSNPG